jgi:hypothetical protein
MDWTSRSNPGIGMNMDFVMDSISEDVVPLAMLIGQTQSRYAKKQERRAAEHYLI